LARVMVLNNSASDLSALLTVLVQCQKRPITVSKETYYSVTRDLFHMQHAYIQALEHQHLELFTVQSKLEYDDILGVCVWGGEAVCACTCTCVCM
jgi:hypothetical protein